MVAAGIALVIAGGLTLLPTGRGDEVLRLNMDVGIWAMWLPLALFAVAAQTGAEELLFRGYLQSQIAARSRSMLAALLVPSLLFAGAHYAPSLPAPTAWAYFGFAALFGLLAGDLTARTGSIGAAWGFHFANNMIAVSVVVMDGSITGLGLLRSSAPLSDISVLSPWIFADLGSLIGIWWVIRRVLD